MFFYALFALFYQSPIGGIWIWNMEYEYEVYCVYASIILFQNDWHPIQVQARILKVLAFSRDQDFVSRQRGSQVIGLEVWFWLYRKGPKKNAWTYLLKKMCKKIRPWSFASIFLLYEGKTCVCGLIIPMFSPQVPEIIGLSSFIGSHVGRKVKPSF